MVLKRIGLVLMTVPVGVFVFDKIVGIYDRVAQAVCGNAFLVERDKNLMAQGLLTENSCGFDADMTAVALSVLAIVVGALFYVIGRINPLKPSWR